MLSDNRVRGEAPKEVFKLDLLRCRDVYGMSSIKLIKPNWKLPCNLMEWRLKITPGADINWRTAERDEIKIIRQHILIDVTKHSNTAHRMKLSMNLRNAEKAAKSTKTSCITTDNCEHSRGVRFPRLHWDYGHVLWFYCFASDASCITFSRLMFALALLPFLMFVLTKKKHPSHKGGTRCCE